MTKEEILKQAYESHFSSQKYEKSNFGHTYKDVSEQALDQYAEQESISFAEWVEDNACCRDGVWYIFGDYKENRWGEVDEDCKKYTTAQLFQLYKTQQTKHQ